MRTATRVVTSSRRTTIDDLLPKFLVYFDASRNITMATSTNISQWVDRVSGLVASQTTSSNQPLINNTAGNLYVNMSSISSFLTINIPTPLNINTSQAYFCFSNAVFSCTVNIPNGITSLEIGRTPASFLLNSIIIFNGFPTLEEDLRIIEFLKTKLAYNSQTLSAFDSGSSSFLIARRITSISNAFFVSITNFSNAWSGCTGLTSFPLLDTSNGTNFTGAWQSCSGLTSFPLLDTSNGTNFTGAWYQCTGLISFPLLNTSNGTNFSIAWQSCSGLTSFPLLNTSKGTNFNGAWDQCTGLTSFPLLDTSNGTNFSNAWQSCSGLTSFPLLNTSKGTNFSNAWRSCTSLTSFPLLNISSGTNFSIAWRSCSNLTNFPANFFDNWVGNPVANCFLNTWDSCTNLTAQSVENILVSIAFSGKSAPAGATGTQADITITYATNTGSLSTATTNAITTLKSRGWKPRINGTYV